jgi:hypothetical protein
MMKIIIVLFKIVQTVLMKFNKILFNIKINLQIHIYNTKILIKNKNDILYLPNKSIFSYIFI